MFYHTGGEPIPFYKHEDEYRREVHRVLEALPLMHVAGVDEYHMKKFIIQPLRAFLENRIFTGTVGQLPIALIPLVRNLYFNQEQNQQLLVVCEQHANALICDEAVQACIRREVENRIEHGIWLNNNGRPMLIDDPTYVAVDPRQHALFHKRSLPHFKRWLRASEFNETDEILRRSIIVTRVHEIVSDVLPQVLAQIIMKFANFGDPYAAVDLHWKQVRGSRNRQK